MNFNHPDRTKEAQEIIFSCKAKEIYHPPLVLNIPVFLSHHPQKTWVVYLTPSQYLMNI